MVFFALSRFGALRTFGVDRIFLACEPGTIAELCRALVHPNLQRRERAFSALGACLYPGTTWACERAKRIGSTPVSSDDQAEAVRAEWQKAAAEQVLATASFAQRSTWLDAARELVAKPTPGLGCARICAAFVLGRLGELEDARLLFDIVERERPDVFFTAALLDTIGEIGGPDATRALFDLATRREVKNIIDKALPSAIAKLGYEAVDPLEAAIVASSTLGAPPLRLTLAARRIAWQYSGALDAWLDHENESVRHAAESAITEDPKYGASRARPDQLLRALQRAQGTHRLRAAQRLAEVGHPGGFDALVSMLQDLGAAGSWGAAAETLVRHGAPGAVKAIEDALALVEVPGATGLYRAIEDAEIRALEKALEVARANALRDRSRTARRG